VSSCFSVHDAALVKHMAERPYGLILACGPTGSGKTDALEKACAGAIDMKQARAVIG
jgi:type II secretory ATPase GspE/PulE/Tfp pilus assembly ATPase PilB-like protein